MAKHQIQVLIPEDHRLFVEVPETVRSGPATLILLTPPEGEAESVSLTENAKDEARSRWQAMRTELAQDRRSFRQLSREEKGERLRRLQGIGRGLLSSSDEIARRKIEEAEIEEAKFAR